jgi:transposase-like protein
MYSAQSAELKKVQAELQAEKRDHEVTSNLLLEFIHDAEDARKSTEQSTEDTIAELRKVQAELQAEKEARERAELELQKLTMAVVDEKLSNKKTNKREPMCRFCPMRS